MKSSLLASVTAPSVIPYAAGVYLFKDDQDIVIYVGKAKSLKKRVASYFTRQKNDERIEQLLKHTVQIESIITNNEAEALLLETKLIQTYQPVYNTLLKEGNPFLYIGISQDTMPKIFVTRYKNKSATFFGPFLQNKHAYSLYSYLIEKFQLYLCKKKIQNGCLDFHLNRCAGICKTEFDKDDYIERIQLAKRVLTGEKNFFIKQLNERITFYNDQLLFEKSKRLNQYLLMSNDIFDFMSARSPEHIYFFDIVTATTAHTHKKNLETDRLQGLEGLAHMIGLEKIPNSIDCFDISHFQGKHITGSSVRFSHGKFDKNQCRRFRIKSLNNQNDYAALEEIIERRYKVNTDLPDIIMVDGGIGQLNSAQQILQKNNISCTVIALAKREEQLFTLKYPPIKITFDNPHGRMLIAIRDYAHHFTITYHKLLRKRAFIR